MRASEVPTLDGLVNHCRIWRFSCQAERELNVSVEELAILVCMEAGPRANCCHVTRSSLRKGASSDALPIASAGGPRSAQKQKAIAPVRAGEPDWRDGLAERNVPKRPTAACAGVLRAPQLRRTGPCPAESGSPAPAPAASPSCQKCRQSRSTLRRCCNSGKKYRLRRMTVWFRED